jgi:hypothetical protein
MGGKRPFLIGLYHSETFKRLPTPSGADAWEIGRITQLETGDWRLEIGD